MSPFKSPALRNPLNTSLQEVDTLQEKETFLLEATQSTAGQSSGWHQKQLGFWLQTPAEASLDLLARFQKDDQNTVSRCGYKVSPERPMAHI